jgi:hypothetical protein
MRLTRRDAGTAARAIAVGLVIVNGARLLGMDDPVLAIALAAVVVLALQVVIDLITKPWLDSG